MVALGIEHAYQGYVVAAIGRPDSCGGQRLEWNVKAIEYAIERWGIEPSETGQRILEHAEFE